MKQETMQQYEVQVTLGIRVLARDQQKAESLVMDFVDGPIFTALLKRKKVTGVTYTISRDNPITQLAAVPDKDATPVAQPAGITAGQFL